jgi:hypothetical protein
MNSTEEASTEKFFSDFKHVREEEKLLMKH